MNPVLMTKTQVAVMKVEL